MSWGRGEERKEWKVELGQGEGGRNGKYSQDRGERKEWKVELGWGGGKGLEEM